MIPRIGKRPVRDHSYNILFNVDVPVRFGRERSILPTNRPLISNTTIRRATTLERIVSRFGAICPRFEQRDVPISAACAGSKRADKVSRLEIIPGNWVANLRETHG